MKYAHFVSHVLISAMMTNTWAWAQPPQSSLVQESPRRSYDVAVSLEEDAELRRRRLNLWANGDMPSSACRVTQENPQEAQVTQSASQHAQVNQTVPQAQSAPQPTQATRAAPQPVINPLIQALRESEQNGGAEFIILLEQYLSITQPTQEMVYYINKLFSDLSKGHLNATLLKICPTFIEKCLASPWLKTAYASHYKKTKRQAPAEGMFEDFLRKMSGIHQPVPVVPQATLKLSSDHPSATGAASAKPTAGEKTLEKPTGVPAVSQSSRVGWMIQMVMAFSFGLLIMLFLKQYGFVE